MINRNAILRASLIETPEGEENLIQITHNGKTYPASEIKYVMDYVGPTGVIVPDGILREVRQNDFTKILNGTEFKIQTHDELGKIIHFD